MNKQVLLINLPLVLYSVPPSGVFYLNGFLTHHKINCDVIDLNLEYQKTYNINIVPPVLPHFQEQHLFDDLCEKNNIWGFLEKTLKNVHEYDIIGLSFHSIQSYLFLKYILDFLEPIKGKAKIIIGGTGAFELINKNLEVEVVQEEGEYFFEKYYNLDNTIELFNYPQLFTNIKFTPDFNILISDGCKNNCNFCVFGQKEKIYFRPPKYIISEIMYLIKKHKKESFNFLCDNLNNSAKKLNELCYYLILAQKIHKFTWHSNFTIEKTQPDFNMLKKAGCTQINVGIETGSELVRKSMNKQVSNEMIISHLDECLKNKINNKFYLMTGYLTETNEEFDKSQQFLKYIFDKYNKIIKEIKITTYTHSNNYCQFHDFENENEIDNWVYEGITKNIRIDRLNEIYNLCKKYDFRVRAFTYE